MPRKDYELFINSIVNNKYYILTYKSKLNAGKYCLNLSKFCKKDTLIAEGYKDSDSYSGIYIDIFPFDNCKLFFAPFHAYFIKIIFNIYKVKLKAIYKKTNMLFFAKIFCSLIPLKLIDFLYRKIYLIFNKNKTSHISYFSSIYGYKRETHRYDVIFPLSKILFEGKYYSSPNNYDSYLKTIYGNYMELPPENARTNHNLKYIIFNNEN